MTEERKVRILIVNETRVARASLADCLGAYGFSVVGNVGSISELNSWISQNIECDAAVVTRFWDNGRVLPVNEGEVCVRNLRDNYTKDLYIVNFGDFGEEVKGADVSYLKVMPVKGMVEMIKTRVEEGGSCRVN